MIATFRAAVSLAFALCFALVAPAAAAGSTAKDPLVKASTDGDVAAVQRLLDAGTNPNRHDEAGLTALNWAAYSGHADIVRLLLAKHADVDSHGNKPGWTPLMNAAAGGYDDVITLLLAAGAKVNMTDANGADAIWYAAAGNKTHTVALLRKNGGIGGAAAVKAQALCKAARAPFGDTKIAWAPTDLGHYGCDSVHHAFAGEGEVIMTTYAVAGDRTGAKTLSIRTQIFAGELPKSTINETLQPLLTNIFAAGGTTLPADVAASAAALSPLQSDTALGHLTATFKPGDDPQRPNSDAEYRLIIELK